MTTTNCPECGQPIPDAANSEVNDAHADSCSLHPANIMEARAQRCACGIPNRANWYVHVSIERTAVTPARHDESGELIHGPLGHVGETNYSDIYVCDTHMPADVAGEMTLSADSNRDFPRYEPSIRSLLKFDNADVWSILEFKVTPLR